MSLDSFSGSIRLIPEGTEVYKLNPTEFIKQLRSNISSILPVDPERLESNGPYQIDTSVSPEQLIIPLQIKSTNDRYQRNAINLQKDLHIMIQNKGFTQLSMYQYTSLLDQTYGYQENVDIKHILQENKGLIIAMIIVSLILVLIFLLAKKRNNRGNNIIIFRIVLSIVAFILDGLFVYKHGADVKPLFIPSLTIFVLSTCFNLLSASMILIFETFQNDEFINWFKSHATISSIFTLLAATNIEILNILSSRFAGMNLFTAKFSKKAQTLIFWLGIITFIMKDVPQFIIQIIYKSEITITYNIIPLLTLITSSLTITFNIIGKLYNSIIQWQEHRLVIANDFNKDNKQG
ncbi:hypothetical protein C1645_457626 [Glomus cerebriforme]|uniref:Uncharacterized protein n=1 Tax=Glomus cerebriforme TaxID=658196 RepID=A0A397TEI0_9GLOM|nr:hypothetical protein C1645_457626 [Glomus cerebriforme]